MKIIKENKPVVRETTIYETDCKFNIIKQTTDGVLDSITLKDTAEVDRAGVYYLDLPNDWYLTYNDLWDLEKYQIKIEDVNDIDENKVFFIDGSSEMIYDHNKDIISKPHRFTYIGSLRERHSDDKVYAKLIELLKVHPYILQLDVENIPHYNADFKNQSGIKLAKAYIPQGEYKKLYDKYVNNSKRGHWYLSVIDEITMSHGYIPELYGKEIADLLIEYNKTKFDY